MKENKKRIVFWFVIMIIFLILGFVGKNSFKNGYGKYGFAKKILEPLATNFNTSEDVKKLTDIRAKVEKDYLVVIYKNIDGKNEKYKFNYYNENNIEYIKNKDEYGNNMWSFIAQEMANAAYHLNGGKGSLFKLYDSKIFGETTLEDGLIYNINSKEVSINIKTNIVKNISGRYKTLKDDIYIKDEDMTKIVNELNTNKNYLYTNDDIKIYITNSNNSYDIYSSITEENIYRSNKSIANIIKALNEEAYKTLNITEDNIIFESSTSYYTSQFNAIFSEPGVYDENDSLFKLTLNK